MVGLCERHFEAKKDRISAERGGADPEVARVRQRLASMGLLKFLLVRYLRTQSNLLSKLLSLWRNGRGEEEGYFDLGY